MQGSPDPLPVLSAGAGIAGLTAALAFARAGWPVTVLERRTRVEETGAGIQVSPNAARVLQALGVGQALARVAAEPERLRVRRGDTGDPGPSGLRGRRQHLEQLTKLFWRRCRVLSYYPYCLRCSA
jgi:2-polyprenyl-6-methoxyphenol hydroxylase-like FAD-dependent oxidoreductase